MGKLHGFRQEIKAMAMNSGQPFGHRGDRPNILLVFTDQQRLDTISAGLNNFKTRTPGIDSLVGRGVSFQNAYCTSPLCSPSRATLMTGLYPSQAGVPGNLGQPSPPLNERIRTIGHEMQDLGYQTVYHGKWHLGGDIHDYGFERVHHSQYDAGTVDAAARFYRDRDWIVNKRPFFHVVSLLNPHDIYFQPPGAESDEDFGEWPNLHDRTENKPWPQGRLSICRDWTPGRRAFYRQFYKEKVEKVDGQIARLLDELYCSGFGPNTFIIFTSDHGDMACEHGIPFKGPYVYDGVMRVPLVIVPPWYGMGGIRPCDPMWKDFTPRVERGIVSLIDMVPTILELGGGTADPSLPGGSLAPTLKGASPGRDAVFGEWHQWGEHVLPIRMVRTPDWKYSHYLGVGEELYNMREDPHEMNNRAGDSGVQDILQAHRNLLKEHVERTKDPVFSLPPAHDMNEK